MKKDLKKIALFGLTAGVSCLSAQEAEVPFEQELQMEDSQEIVMGQSEDCPPRPEDCSGIDVYSGGGISEIRRDRTSCRANCGCGSNTDRDTRKCKKPYPKRRGAAKEAMNDN